MVLLLVREQKGASNVIGKPVLCTPLLLVAAMAAMGQTRQESPVSWPGHQNAGCTALIQAGQDTTENLPVIYNNRGANQDFRVARFGTTTKRSIWTRMPQPPTLTAATPISPSPTEQQPFRTLSTRYLRRAVFKCGGICGSVAARGHEAAGPGWCAAVRASGSGRGSVEMAWAGAEARSGTGDSQWGNGGRGPAASPI